MKMPLYLMIICFFILGCQGNGTEVKNQEGRVDTSGSSKSGMTDGPQCVTQPKQDTTKQVKTMEKKSTHQEIKVTFIELGSVNCIPCKMMKPVMETIEKEYGDQVQVVFHDIWTAEGQPYAKQFLIRSIPTQVFLDKDGKEYYRHEGFFPQEELVKILKLQGVK
jgi:thioredoxin 1